jgi:aryl carrier-like protein
LRWCLPGHAPSLPHRWPGIQSHLPSAVRKHYCFYTHIGRIDDIVVFPNGEKTNPITFQNEVAKHSEVRAALLVGEQRQEAALPVEPRDETEFSAQDRRYLIEKIWPAIEESNTRCPQHAKVSKDRVLVTSPGMPFLRAGKGTVQRQGTLALYKNAIDALYEHGLPENETTSDLPLVSVVRTNEVTNTVRHIARDLNGGVVTDTTNFFSVGMDSLQVIRLQRASERALPHILVTTRMIYSDPTVESIAKLFTRQASAHSLAVPLRDDSVFTAVQSYRARRERLDLIYSTLCWKEDHGGYIVSIDPQIPKVCK